MSSPLVSIGLPVRNGQDSLPDVIASVLGQDYPNIELVISDNASTDGTQDICRGWAARDPRVVYRRHERNIGLVANFVHAIESASGEYFRWIGDDDRLDPACVSRCVELFRLDPRLVLVTTQIEYTLPDGSTASAAYRGTALGSDDPAERLGEMLRLFTAGFTVLDPLYGMVKRRTVAALPRPSILLADQVLAARIALVGPSGHVPEVLAYRGWGYEPRTSLARKLDVPTWTARTARAVQCLELLRCLPEFALTPEQRTRARWHIARYYGRQLAGSGRRAGRKVRSLLTPRSPAAVG